MDSDSWIRLVLFGLFILGGGYFAGSETSYASINKIRIRTVSEAGDRRAGHALFILDNFDRALTTILIGNNIMHIGGASIATLFVTSLWGAKYVTLSTVIVTIIMFFLAEMLPKSYAKSHSESLALRHAGSLKGLMVILKPIAAMFTGISNLVTRLFVKEEAPTITEDELYDIMETIEEEGVIEAEKRELMQSALEFNDITAQNILIPRVDLAALDIEDSNETILKIIKEEKYSRYPVYEGSIDNIIGVLQARRFLKRYLKQVDFSIRDIMAEPYFTHKKIPIDDLLKDMRLKKVHMAIISDDYGGTMGIVTIEDILEELVGEIWDEDDEVIEEFKKLADGRCEVSADLMVDDAFDRMDADYTEEETRFESVGAWVLAHFETIPQKGDEFTDLGMNVKILQVVNNRITTVMMQKVESAQVEAEEADV